MPLTLLPLGDTPCLLLQERVSQLHWDAIVGASAWFGDRSKGWGQAWMNQVGKKTGNLKGKIPRGNNGQPPGLRSGLCGLSV